MKTQPFNSEKYSGWITFAIGFICLISPLFTAASPRLSLSLDEAILLAVRSNPNVQNSQLNEVLQKFNLYVQKWQFQPHFSFQASAGFTESRNAGNPIVGTHNFAVQPGMSLVTPIGTRISLNSTNPQTNNYNPALSTEIMQPLMRGFGTAVVEAALNDAKDAEIIAGLNVEGVLRNTVTAVINAYLDVVTAERTIIINEDALSRAQHSVQQTKLFIKAGHLAGNELVTVQANAASAEAQLEYSKNNLDQARYALLAAIGVGPDSPIDFSTLKIEDLISQYHLPSLETAKQKVLENDIQYQIDQITLNGPIKRNVLVANDNTRWQLNLTATAVTGNGSGGGPNAGIDSLFNGLNQYRGVTLSLQIPIDDQQSKQAVLNAKIAVKEAELSLLQEKWNKETSAINAWHTAISAERSLSFAEDAEKLQEKTYQISYQKYLHGLIDSLELQTAQLQLIQAQQTRLAAQIAYLKALVNIDLLIGHTLTTWHVKVRW